jgi:protein-tyrosine-phosphatase
MAEYYAKKIFNDKGGNTNIALSAGLYVGNSYNATKYAIMAIAKKGIDMSKHVPRQLTAKMLKEADLVLTMTTSHKDSIISNYPEYIDKIYTLKEYAACDEDDYDIFDPYGQAYTYYEKCLNEICDNIDKIFL